MSANINSELNEWLEMLRSPDVSDRLVAVKTLQHLGDEAAIDNRYESQHFPSCRMDVRRVLYW